ncbi:MAG: hypothetical protein E6K70_20380, partial [Planctomycetota bacterium]
MQRRLFPLALELLPGILCAGAGDDGVLAGCAVALIRLVLRQGGTLDGLFQGDARFLQIGGAGLKGVFQAGHLFLGRPPGGQVRLAADNRLPLTGCLPEFLLEEAQAVRRQLLEFSLRCLQLAQVGLVPDTPLRQAVQAVVVGLLAEDAQRVAILAVQFGQPLGGAFQIDMLMAARHPDHAQLCELHLDLLPKRPVRLLGRGEVHGLRHGLVEPEL